MTDPWEDLNAFSAAAAMQAQPLSTAEVRRRAVRRRRLQLVGVIAAVTFAVVGTGMAVATSEAWDNRTDGPSEPGSTSAPTPGGPTGTSTHGTGKYREIPVSYPWSTFIDDPGGDGSVDGPGATVPLPTLKPCGRHTWNPTGVIAQRAVRSNIPESSQVRQVLLFTNRESAQTAIDDVRDTFARCPIERYPGGFATEYDTEAQQPGVGDSRLAVSARSTFHRAPAIGRIEMRWVSLDNAVFFTWEPSEAMSDSTAPGHEADQRVRQMVTAWCEIAGHC